MFGSDMADTIAIPSSQLYTGRYAYIHLQNGIRWPAH